MFPQTWEDTAAAEKSKMCDSETLDAPVAICSLSRAGEHAGAYHSLDESRRELGLVVVIKKLGCALKTEVHSEVKARRGTTRAGREIMADSRSMSKWSYRLSPTYSSQ